MCVYHSLIFIDKVVKKDLPQKIALMTDFSYQN